jgi:fatty-acyl-CoA synthase
MSTTLRLPRMLRWLDEPRADAGISFSRGPDAGWERFTYPELAAAALHASARLRDLGIGPGDRVIIAIPASPAFVATLFGAWWAGATIAPIPIPLPMQSMQRYRDRTALLLAAAQPRLLVTSSELLETMTELAGPLGITVTEGAFDASAGAPRNAPALGAHEPLLQFTSGSSGPPRATRITWENLESNLAAQVGWLEPDEHTILASWLPLYHDMGLTGGLLFPVATQSSLLLSSPEEFLISPLQWVRCFGELHATISPAPTFAFDYVTRRVPPDELAGMDFSGWRAAVVGAERVDAGVLHRFTELLAPFGFDPATIRPAYGMAEATLAVAGHGSGRPATVIRPDWARLEADGTVVVEARGRLGDALEGAGWLVANGPPLGDYEVDVLDPDGHVLGEGRVGELRLRGDNVADGWLGPPPEGTSTRIDGRDLHTGDHGFILHSEVYVIGRIGDSLKVRGRIVYAEPLEERIATACELEPRLVVAVLGVREGVEVAALVADVPVGAWVETAAAILRRETSPHTEIEIYCGKRRSILRTSSGKPRRRVLWDLVRHRTLPAELVYPKRTP